MGFNGEKVIIFWSQSLHALDYTLFVDLNDNLSCEEFDCLLCNLSVKGCRENTMRKTACVGNVTLKRN
jgi:hypothetical protein